MNLYMFDCFGVIYTEVAPSFFRERKMDEKEIKVLMKKYFYDVDTGKLKFIDAVKNIAKDYNNSFDEVFNAMIKTVKPIKSTLAYIKELRKEGHKTLLLTNAGRDNFDYLHDIDFNEYFDKVIISSDYGIAKPDLRIYQIALDSMKEYKFDKIYFTDDNIENIKILKDTNIIGILFNKSI